MTSNLICHIKLIQEKDIMSSISDLDDISHSIFYELATEIDLEDSKFIWVSDYEYIFDNLNEKKVKNISTIFEKYYELEDYDIADDILNSNFENLYFNKSFKR